LKSLFESGALPLDVVLMQVSPPDAHGFVSLGTTVDCTLTAVALREDRDCGSQPADAAHAWRHLHCSM
jgi:acyl-CoA hydrolase